MMIRISAILILLLATPVWAQDGPVLEHQLLDVKSTAGSTQLSYRLTLNNPTAHQYHDIRLQLEDVTLSLSSEADVLEFHTLAAGGSKYRFLRLSSNLTPAELQQNKLLLFHLQAVDENGETVTHLLRSERVQP
jgi:hypothetical protein